MLNVLPACCWLLASGCRLPPAAYLQPVPCVAMAADTYTYTYAHTHIHTHTPSNRLLRWFLPREDPEPPRTWPRVARMGRRARARRVITPRRRRAVGFVRRHSFINGFVNGGRRRRTLVRGRDFGPPRDVHGQQKKKGDIMTGAGILPVSHDTRALNTTSPRMPCWHCKSTRTGLPLEDILSE